MKPMARLRMAARSATESPVHRFAVEPIFAGRGRVEQADDGEERGLAAAGWPGDGDELAFADVEMHICQGVGFQFFGVEDLAEAVQVN